ncbi:MAG: type VI secretion system tube protein Hcp [Phycisphaerales bacterium]|nr:type VI secretion system tube protein Hcp [Phycisphaerales bacterium]
MAADIFMKIDGIEGDSNDAMHKKWIEVESATFSISNDDAGYVRPRGGGGGGESGGGEQINPRHSSTLNEFSITKHVDVATPLIALACCDGRNIKSVTIDFCRPIGEKIVYLKYVLLSCGITSTSLKDGSSDDPIPKEELKIKYAELHMIYTHTIASGGGKVGHDVRKGWNQAEHKEVVPP